MAGLGKARQARYGKVRHGKAWQARRVAVVQGTDLAGMARRGKAWKVKAGKAGRGLTRNGTKRLGRRGESWHGATRFVKAGKVSNL